MSRYGRYSEKQAFSYMDNVPVKISEQFKPPRKVTLPVSFQHWLSSEKATREYDFGLEKRVLEKMEEWGKLQKSAVEDRRVRIKRADGAVATTSQASVSSTPADSRVSLPVFSQPAPADSRVSLPVFSQPAPADSRVSLPVFSQPILTPVPIAPVSTDVVTSKASAHFNFSDFEADTSSPFDNMELKTINDMEELAHVLQPNQKPPESEGNAYSTPVSVYNVDQAALCHTFDSKLKKDSHMHPHMNGLTGYSLYGAGPRAKQQASDIPYDYSYYTGRAWPPVVHHHAAYATIQHPPLTYGVSFPSTCNSNQDQHSPGRSLSKSVPDIVQELEKELKSKQTQDATSHTPPPRPNSFGSTGLENWKPWPDLDSPPGGKTPSPSCSKHPPAKVPPRSKLPNPFMSLNPNAQALVKNISEMGFALPRVARACQLLGEDYKEIVEYLLQVQGLEERNYPGDRVEKALIVNRYDTEHAVKYLDALTQLLDLGFPEDRVSDALVMFDNDRDKALDKLIS